MTSPVLLVTLVMALVMSLVSQTAASYTEEDAKTFMAELESEAQKLYTASVFKEYDYDLSLSDSSKNDVEAAQKAYSTYLNGKYPELMKYPWQTFQNSLLKRQFYLFSIQEEDALPQEKRDKFNSDIIDMTQIYSSTNVTEYKSNNASEPLFLEDIQVKIADPSVDPEEKTYYWKEWHDRAGTAVKTFFQDYVELNSEVAKLNNFSDGAAYHQYRYETPDLETQMDGLMEKIRPFFLQLHAYVRRQLYIKYGSRYIDLKGPIPASMLGNLWALDAINTGSFSTPFPNKPPLDIVPQLEAQNFTGLKMAQAAEAFYVSINLTELPSSFYKDSIFEAPADKIIDCSDLAYNFCDGQTYRMKICAQKTLDDFGRVHHEMGHVQNYLRFSQLPFIFEDGANPGFNEGTSDMAYLYATNPVHLKRIGLLDSSLELDQEQQINSLYQIAVSNIFFLPYAHSLERWRWRALRGDITPDQYNCDYWRIRLEEHGVEPPVDRDWTQLDPAAKYHVVGNLPYIQYIISGIVSYQYYRTLCELTGLYDPANPSSNPLHMCDITGKPEAGNRLKKMMDLGRSRPWQEALQAVTGSTELDAGALLEYFQPLYDWLVKENQKNNEHIGWTTNNKRCYEKGETTPEVIHQNLLQPIKMVCLKV